MIPSVESIIAITSGCITILGAVLQLIPILKYKIKKYLLQLTLIAAGVFNGVMYSISTIPALLISLVLLILIIRGLSPKIILKLISETPSTIISKSALYSRYCENIYRLCQAIVGNDSCQGDDIRVSLFLVGLKKESLIIVGRYPVRLSSEIPDIEYKLGEGTSGCCAKTGAPNLIENLPAWEENEQEHINLLSSKFSISGEAIRRFHRNLDVIIACQFCTEIKS